MEETKKYRSLAVAEMFYSLQGEGRTMGRPAVFLRLAGCNLMCGGAGTEKDKALHNGATWRCDTIEVWRKGNKYSPAEVIREMDSQFGYMRLVSKGVRTIITGGEPLLQQGAIMQFIEEVRVLFPDAIFEVETNGTFAPNPKLAQAVNYWNVSPKLSNSGMEVHDRIESGVLQALNILPQTMFKFVVSNQNDVNEIHLLIEELKLDKAKIWLMPAASTLTDLVRANKFVAEVCINNQFNFSSRLQVEIWDKTTGV